VRALLRTLKVQKQSVPLSIPRYPRRRFHNFMHRYPDLKPSDTRATNTLLPGRFPEKSAAALRSGAGPELLHLTKAEHLPAAFLSRTYLAPRPGHFDELSFALGLGPKPPATSVMVHTLPQPRMLRRHCDCIVVSLSPLWLVSSMLCGQPPRMASCVVNFFRTKGLASPT